MLLVRLCQHLTCLRSRCGVSVARTRPHDAVTCVKRDRCTRLAEMPRGAMPYFTRRPGPDQNTKVCIVRPLRPFNPKLE